MAAGIVNPITGRRFVKSWRIEELRTVAHQLYRALSDELGRPYWFDLPLVRTLYNRGDENDWLARSGEAAYANFLDDAPQLGRLPELTAPVHAYAGVRHAARVDVGNLVEDYRKKLIASGRFTAAATDYNLLNFTPAGATYPQLGSFDRVVCCEGWRARHNPWFAYLPHGGNKGEVLTVRTTAPLLQRMFKHRVFLVPRSDGTYWIGATSENRFADDSPTPAGKQFLSARLSEVLTVPYEITEHRAAVRPTVRDRRPLLGVHPENERLFIFNGLGTKGASLAPLSSTWLADFLTEGKALPAEVDVRRFPKK